MTSQDSKRAGGCQAQAGGPPPSFPRPPTPGDIAVVLAALVAAAALALNRPASGPEPDQVVVEVSGQPVERRPLDGPTRIEVRGPLGPSVIAVEPGRARVLSSPCRHQVCVHRGWLTRSGDLAACVPNHLVVRLSGGVGAFDGVSR